MLTLSPCLDLLFGDDGPSTTHADRIHRAAEQGFEWAEMWGWRSVDTAMVAMALADTGLHLNLITSEPTARIVDPSTHEQFLRGVEESAKTARALQCRQIVALAGNELPGVAQKAQHQAVVTALRRAAPIAASLGVTVLLENLNTRVDHVGYFLSSTTETLDVIDEVDHPSVRMLYDMYHSVVMDESPAEVLAGRLDRVGHVQIADVPGRHEPGSGRVDWDRELRWLVTNGYHGLIGLEYSPTANTRSSFVLIQDVVGRLNRDGHAVQAGERVSSDC